jgi:hypothetical protein
VEHTALTAIEGEHGLIDGDACEGLVDDVARNTGCGGVAPHGRQESVEIAAALRGMDRRGEQDAKEN